MTTREQTDRPQDNPRAKLVLNAYRDARRRGVRFQRLVDEATAAAEIATFLELHQIEVGRANVAERALANLWNIKVGAMRIPSVGSRAGPAPKDLPEPPGTQGSSSRRRGSARPRGGRAGSVEAA